METDIEKNQFRKDWYNKQDDVPIKLLIKDNPVPSLDSLTIGEFETILYSLEQSNKHPGLSGKAYENLIKKLEKLQNGVETNKEQVCECKHYGYYEKQFCTTCDNEKIFPEEGDTKPCTCCQKEISIDDFYNFGCPECGENPEV